MSDGEIIGRIGQVLRVRPGDRVLLTIRDDSHVSPEYVDNVRQRLGDRFPGVEFVILAGLDIAAVERGT